MNSGLRVLSAASEFFPLVKTGGLADVAGALPAVLGDEAVDMRVLLPGYPAVLSGVGSSEQVLRLPDLFGGDAAIMAARLDGAADLFVLDAPHLYGRGGNPYVGPDGRDWPDNAQRFAALAWAAREIGLGRLESWQPDVVHAHDWQAGLAPAYLALADGDRPATVVTVHNLAFQGQFPIGLLGALRLPATALATDGVEYYGSIGFLKAGLFYADMISTVSPTYACEIRTAAGGMGLQGLLTTRADRLVGIVNGIDLDVWDPGTDPHLEATYTARTLRDRAANKAALRARLGLTDDAGGPLVCVVSRLAWQKGIDLLLAALPRLLQHGGQLAVLGSGDPEIEAGFRAAVRDHPGQVGCVYGYDEPLSHLMQGGADAIAVPSRFEPCGLTQLYGLRYGCVPVVARVGGLADTVIDANEAALGDGVATGVQVDPDSADALAAGFDRLAALFHDRRVWTALQKRGMSRSLGWPARAPAYAELFRRALAAQAR